MKMKKIKTKHVVIGVVSILLLIVLFLYTVGNEDGLSVIDSIANGYDTIFNARPPGGGGGTPPPTTPPEDEESTPTWTQIGSGSGWSFIEPGGYKEWQIELGGITLGMGGDTQYKVEVWRRWNFKTVFTCDPPADLIWCLHDSLDRQIWHKTDTQTILTPGVTDTITTLVVYDNITPWTMFIGNNFACDVDCHWTIKVYELK